MKGRQPTAEEKRHMNAVAQLGCIVCRLRGYGETPAAIHHLEGKTKPGAHFLVIPLCGIHHQTGGYGTALHAGKKAFEKKFGTESYLLEQTTRLLNKEAI